MSEETGWFPGEPVTAAQAGPPVQSDGTPAPRGPRPTDPDIGVVRDLQQRTESQGSGGDAHNDQILTFRVERFDGAGDRRPAIAVEMRGEALWGVVAEGNWVQVPPDWTPGGLVTASQMRNVTTDSLFGVTRRARAYPQAIAGFVLLIGFAVFGIGFARSDNHGPSPLASFGLALVIGSVLVYAFVELTRRTISQGRRPGPRRRAPRAVVIVGVAGAVVGVFLCGVVIADATGLSGLWK